MIGLKISYLLVITAVLLYVRSGVVCSPLCLTGDFDSQLKHILQEEMLSSQDHEDIISQVLDDVQDTLDKRWQGVKITPFGSLSTGLATKTSDADVSIQLRKVNSADSYVVQELEKLFKKQPALYSDVDSKSVPETFIHFSLYHIPSQRNVDLLFRYGEGAVYNSKLIKYYLNLDERFLPLTGVLKYWFTVHGLADHGRYALPNYGLYLLIIFYLQQKNMAPPGYVLQVDSISHYFNNWNVGFNELPYSSKNTENLHQLLGGFFKYYSKFNFEEYIVSPFTGRPIPRNAFVDIDKFPKEYSLYNNTLKHTLQLKIKNDLNISTDICIQDVFVHDSNTGKRLTHEYATKFKDLMKSAAAMFEDLPRDSFLRAILVTDEHNETVIGHNNVTENGINSLDCKVAET